VAIRYQNPKRAYDFRIKEARRLEEIVFKYMKGVVPSDVPTSTGTSISSTNHCTTCKWPLRAAQCSAFRCRPRSRLPGPPREDARIPQVLLTRKRHTSRWPEPAAQSSAEDPWRSVATVASHPFWTKACRAAKSPARAASRPGSPRQSRAR
jgi:hypothetical protein